MELQSQLARGCMESLLTGLCGQRLECQHPWTLSVSQEGFLKHEDPKQGGALLFLSLSLCHLRVLPHPHWSLRCRLGQQGWAGRHCLFGCWHSPRPRMSQTQVSWLLAQFEDAQCVSEHEQQGYYTVQGGSEPSPRG